jgi:iron complex transport system ATP-binding protein
MIEAKDITFRVGSRELLSDISATFEAGRLHLIIGPNGAGKSTLIKALARSLRPQDGSVRYDGVDIGTQSEAALAQRRAVLSQAVEVAFPLSVREVVMMGRYPHFGGSPGPVDEEIVDELVDFFEVREFVDRDYLTLSGGERQRVNFARVLAQLWPSPHVELAGSRYLFLDEPLTFLDIQHQIAFLKKIREFTSQPDVVTVGVVHDLNLAIRFADQLLLLDAGRVIARGTPREVLTAERIRQIFRVEPTFVPLEPTGLHLIFD